MCILSDVDILRELKTGNLVIRPIDLEKQIGPCSVDLKMGNEALVLDRKKMVLNNRALFKMEDDIEPYMERIVLENSLVIQPGENVLITNMEWIEIPNNMRGRIDGRSSLARRFLEVHSTGGFIDSGFSGKITLEVTNKLNIPQELKVGERVCQLELSYLAHPCEKPYSGKYKDQKSVTPSKLHLDFPKKVL
ncbi:MAG: dCTP deaminase [Candidatus Hodarchaeota archaeon]